MSVTAKTMELVDNVNTLMGEYINVIGGMEIMNLNPEEFKLIKSSVELMRLSGEVMLEQAKTIEDINYKLDLLLSREEERRQNN